MKFYRPSIDSETIQRARVLGFRSIVADKIESKMDSLGITQKALSEAVAMSPGNLSRILSGSRNMTLDTLFGLADAMNCKIELELKEKESASMIDAFQALAQFHSKSIAKPVSNVVRFELSGQVAV